jgi:hypothetical protein
MTETPTPSKRALLDALHATRDEVLSVIRSLSPAQLEEGRYERGWKGREILSHVASIEWTYPRLIDVARAAATEPDRASGADAEPPAREMRGGNDAYNERQVAKRAHMSVAELLAEFERNRAATIQAVEDADEALLARRIRSAGGRVGPLATVFHDVAVTHVLGHVRDIAGRR